jgi:hypothetical protein
MEDARNEDILRPLDPEIVPLWGEVASIEITVDVRSDDARYPEGDEDPEEFEERLFYILADLFDRPYARYRYEDREQREERDRLKTDLQELVKESLGAEFEARIGDVRRGSLAVFTVVIVASQMVYKAIKDYPDFVKSLDLLKTHIRQLIDRAVKTRLGKGNIQPAPLATATNSILLPGPAMYLAQSVGSFQSGVTPLWAYLRYLSAVTTFLGVGILAILVVVLILLFR